MEKTNELPFDKAFMAAIKDMVFIVKNETNSILTYAFLNQAVFERTNLTEAAIGKTFQEVHDGNLADVLTMNYGQVLSIKEAVTYVDSYISPAGNSYYSESTLTPLFNEDGNCSYIIGVVKDTTAERLAKMESQEAWKRIKESRSRYRSLYDNNANAILSLDLTGRIQTGNSAVEQLTGFTPSEITGVEFSKFIYGKDSKLLDIHYKQTLIGVIQDFRTKFRDKSGHLIGVSIQFAPIEEESEIVGIYAVLRDMREIDHLINQYAESENRFRIIAENAHDVIVLMNYKGEILYVSPSIERVYGFIPEEYMEKPPFHNVHPEDISLVKNIYKQAVKEAKNYVIEIRMKHKTTGWHWSELQGTPIFNEQDQFIHMLTITRDITLQKEHEAKLHYYAYHDSLTGLPNRRFFKQRLSEEIASGQDNNEILAVILLDIDHFKRINDQLGHEVGDAVIEEFGRRISHPLEEHDLAARLGGDEFVLLLPSVTTREGAEQIAQKIQLAMKAPWTIHNGPPEVTASMGITLIPLTEATVSSVLKSADLAMYEAKEAGRGTYRLLSL
ncbi:sensor domain-containing protein [Planococcus soli]|uniref:sensor domain-containing protein n=1 Tax=Planococcus soli TaxID=2666072 RepID=UPI00163DDB21|nr:diguanylate cyclase [Planococcus soli]